ncbi:hypothetical protein M0802_002279 [Mischocyttarus mexicanus]|nr:hypothetical protein M0802_002279 [Mischocyttarus mexicanus]
MVKAKGVQKITTEQLENEINKLTMELLATTCKMNEIEKIVEKFERSQRNYILSSGIGVREIENGEGKEEMGEPFDEIKVNKNSVLTIFYEFTQTHILEPSFPPSRPPEPPPRKYGIFASRPFSGTTPQISIATQNKIGFK